VVVGASLLRRISVSTPVVLTFWFASVVSTGLAGVRFRVSAVLSIAISPIIAISIIVSVPVVPSVSIVSSVTIAPALTLPAVKGTSSVSIVFAVLGKMSFPMADIAFVSALIFFLRLSVLGFSFAPSELNFELFSHKIFTFEPKLNKLILFLSFGSCFDRHELDKAVRVAASCLGFNHDILYGSKRLKYISKLLIQLFA
jgi:hypothetical protein